MIHIIIPVHNRIDYTITCLNSIKKQKYIDCKIIIIDDGSIDSTRLIILEHYPEVKIIKGNGNLWWTGATNLGVKSVLCGDYNNKDYILTLNNDVVLCYDTLNILVKTSQKNNCAIVGALGIDNSSDRIVGSGYKFLSWIFNITSYPYKNIKYNSAIKGNIMVDALPGRCVLYPLAVFNDIGNFDYCNFPHYNGDTEYTIRAKRRGWDLILDPKATIYINSEATGLNPMFRNITLKEMIQSFTSIKSSNNIKIRTKFALNVAPWYAKPTYLIITYIKIFIESLIGIYRYIITR